MIIIYIVTSIDKSNNKQKNIKVLMITLFLTRMFSFFLESITYEQALFHSFLPFPEFQPSYAFL